MESSCIIESLPITIESNQFYYYNKKTGDVGVGDIVGKSALSIKTVLRIGEAKFITSYNLGDSNTYQRPITLDKNFRCFFRYQDFINEYTRFKGEQAAIKAERSHRPVRYIVDKNSYFCRKRYGKSIPYNFKEFNNKEEALEYSNKGLSKLKNFVKKYLPLFRELKISVENAKTEIFRDLRIDEVYGLRIYDFRPKFEKIKIGDTLFKIETRNINNSFYYQAIVSKFSVSVSEYIGRDMMKLSDGTLLLKSENYGSLFNINAKDKIEKILIKANLEKLSETLKSTLNNLEKIEKYCEIYNPLISRVENVYVNRDYFVNLCDSGSIALERIKSDAQDLYSKIEQTS